MSPRKKEQQNNQDSLFNTLPHYKEAEMSVLGAMLLNDEALLKALETLKEEDFYIDAHKKIFTSISEIFETTRNVDAVLLIDHLKRKAILEEVGGPEYIMALTEMVVSPALIEHHSKVLQEKSIYRKVIQISEEILKMAFSTSMPAEELLDHAEQQILSIREREIRKGFAPLEILIYENLKEVESMISRGSHITGVPSGYVDLDNLTGGFQKGDLIIIASRPSVGKTSFALNIMRYLSVEHKIPSAIFSIEMPAEHISSRIWCMEAMVNLHRFKTANLKEEDLEKLTRIATKFKDTPIFIDDSAAISILELRAKARRIKREKDIAIIFVDYLQLIRGPENSENRQQEIAAISRSLKALAKELEIPVVALSQLNRAPEHRSDKRPQLSDLRESGALEQDADVVIFLHREQKDEELYQSEGTSEGNTDIIEVNVAKNRNGPIGTLKLVFLKDYTRFENYTEESLPF